MFSPFISFWVMRLMFSNSKWISFRYDYFSSLEQIGVHFEQMEKRKRKKKMPKQFRINTFFLFLTLQIDMFSPEKTWNRCKQLEKKNSLPLQKPMISHSPHFEQKQNCSIFWTPIDLAGILKGNKFFPYQKTEICLSSKKKRISERRENIMQICSRCCYFFFLFRTLKSCINLGSSIMFKYPTHDITNSGLCGYFS